MPVFKNYSDDLDFLNSRSDRKLFRRIRQHRLELQFADSHVLPIQNMHRIIASVKNVSGDWLIGRIMDEPLVIRMGQGRSLQVSLRKSRHRYDQPHNGAFDFRGG